VGRGPSRHPKASHHPTKHANLNIVAELSNGIGGALSLKMDHLVCFLPDSIALCVTNALTEAEARCLPSREPKT
jgi:mannosyl-oligosaccharide alpha-1,2-mannosidase